MRVRVSIGFALLIASASAPALTLAEAVDLALRNDPTFLAAEANLRVSHARARQALAGLLPQLSASANAAANQREYTAQPSNAWLNSTPPRTSTLTESYISNSATVSLSQPLWRHSSMIAITQADFSVDQADFQLAAAEQDLLLRLANAWFDTMQARDTVQVAEAQVEFAHQQWDISREGYEKGVVSLAKMEASRADYQLATAELAVKQSELEISVAALEQIIGTTSQSPPHLSSQILPPLIADETLASWLARAGEANPSLLAAQRALEAANEEIRKQRAVHEPTLDLVASYGRTSQEAGISGGQPGFESYDGSVGLQLNVPLYSGGGQSARVREAVAMRDAAAQELEAARRNAGLSVKQAWFSWRANVARETSSSQAVQSALLALKGAQLARERGVKADVDVLQAQQQYALAQRDWRKARYDGIASRLKLKAACGQLNRDDLTLLDSAMVFAPD